LCVVCLCFFIFFLLIVIRVCLEEKKRIEKENQR